MRFIPPALKQWSLERWDRIDNCVVSCGLLKPVVRKQPKSNSVFASCQVSGIWCPSSGMKWFCLCSQTSAVLFADPWLVVNRSLNLWLFTFESWGLPVWAGGALCCLSVTLSVLRRRSLPVSAASWTPLRTPTTRTHPRWWLGWTSWNGLSFKWDRKAWMTSRAGKRDRLLKSQLPAWCRTTGKESSQKWMVKSLKNVKLQWGTQIYSLS